MPGSTEPERAAIGTPSSGVKPMLVSTERPSSTAETEHPPPRWQTTSRSRNALRRPLHRKPMEAEAPQAPLLRPAARDRVDRRLVGDGRVEGSVEHGHVRDVRQYAARLLQRLQRRCVVQRRDQRQVGDLLLDLGVDDHGRLEAGAPVDDAVADRLDAAVELGVRLDPPARLVGRDEVQLQARGAGVDDKDVQGRQPTTDGARRPGHRVSRRAFRRRAAKSLYRAAQPVPLFRYPPERIPLWKESRETPKGGFMNRFTGSRRFGRFVAVLAVFACVTAAIAATGQGRTVRAMSPRSTQATTTITLAHWASSTVETQLLRQVLAAFQKRNPTIKVNELALDPYPTQMLAQFAARKPPDVFYVDSNVFPDWAEAELLEPLERPVKRTHFKTNKFYPRLLNGFKQGSTIYGFPKDWSPLGMEINTTCSPRRTSSRRRTGRAPVPGQKLKSSDAVPGGRPLCLYAGLGPPARVRLPEQGLVPDANRARRPSTPAPSARRRQLLRRHDQVRPRRHTRPARRGLVR